ncbi:MAG: LysE family translocator [Planctomycetota bacterium]
MRGRWAIFGSAFVIGLSGAMMPGPLLSACIGYTFEEGFLAGGPLLILGHGVLEAALVAAVLLGLGRVLARKSVGAGIGIVGGGVLLWMGTGMTAFVAGGGALGDGASASALPTSPVVAGVLISLANPYWSLWWATIGLKYIALSRERGRLGVAAFGAGHLLSDVGWYLFVAGVVAVFREAEVLPPTVYQWVIRACGVVLLGFGVWFLVAGIRHFVRWRRQSVVAEQA